MREIGEFFACCSYFVILSSKSLIWVQTVYNVYQQMVKVAISRYQVKHKMGEYKKTQDCETFVKKSSAYENFYRRTWLVTMTKYRKTLMSGLILLQTVCKDYQQGDTRWLRDKATRLLHNILHL